MRGYTLIEFAVAMALGVIALALVGSVFVATLSIQRRGHRAREVETLATTLVDLISRDVRNASRAPGIREEPPFDVEEGRPLLAIARAPSRSEAAPEWILYLYDANRGEVHRQVVVQEPDGRATVQQSRIVARGVTQIEVTRVGNGVSVEVLVQRGRETARARGTAEPRNP